MTKEELLTALRSAPGPSRELDAEIFELEKKLWPPEPLYTSSLDAAAAFRKRELPGWDYANGNNSVPWAWVRKSLGEHIFLERCATECLSIVAAVVAGVIAKEKSNVAGA